MMVAPNSKGPPNEDGRLLQGQGQVDVCEVPYGEADPSQRRLWDELWSWLLSPIEEAREGQGEESYRPQPEARGGRTNRRRTPTPEMTKPPEVTTIPEGTHDDTIFANQLRRANDASMKELVNDTAPRSSPSSNLD